MEKVSQLLGTVLPESRWSRIRWRSFPDRQLTKRVLYLGASDWDAFAQSSLRYEIHALTELLFGVREQCLELLRRCEKLP